MISATLRYSPHIITVCSDEFELRDCDSIIRAHDKPKELFLWVHPCGPGELQIAALEEENERPADHDVSGLTLQDALQ
jgi:hypothetical protein